MKPSKTLDDLSTSNRCKLMVLTTVSISLLVLSVTPAFVDPIILSAQYAFRIAKDSLVYNILSKEIAGALVEAYIFNITNADKFLAGEDYKLKVEEIGPFTYQEYRTNDDFYLNEEDKTLHYSPNITSRFLRDSSVADPKDVNVTVPNIPLLAMGSTMNTYPYWTQMAFNMLVNRLDIQPILNLNAHDFLWGYKDPLIAMGNTIMPGWIDFETLGMMDRLYDKKVKDKVVIGTSAADKFRIKAVNGLEGIKKRGFDPNTRDKCNTFENTYEGIAYPPNLTPDTKLRVYRNVFCRILDLQYSGSKDLDFGPTAYVYRFSNDTFRKTPENHCLCGKVCVDGMTDLSSCFYGFAVSFSQAHFLDVNPELYERIEGMKPNFDEHGSEFVVDPNIGSVMDTRITLQLNIVMDNANSNARTKPFSNLIIPVLYFKIKQPELPEETKDGFRKVYILFPRILLAIQAVLLLTAVGLMTYAMRYMRFSWFSKKATGFQINGEKQEHAYEEPLIEGNGKFVAEIISNKNFVDQVHIRA